MNYRGLVAGLGNPGQKYAGTRHNMGFMFIDDLLDLAGRDGEVRELNGRKFQAALWAVSMPRLSGAWLCAKPLTFMNDSGVAVKPLLAWHNLAPDALVVVQDEMDIPAGELRFKFGGGSAGHNGIRSICAQLGSQDFYRLRIGIGKPLLREETLAWVLGRQDQAEREKIQAIMPYALETFFIFADKGLAPAMQYAHTAAKLLAQGRPAQA
ncbi:MAG: aminoacyl-tRNA hydrolase [Desulfovibrio sp.]|nr:aminoacyl-tRNA hydrolase [Desulfovibrio sp.]